MISELAVQEVIEAETLFGLLLFYHIIHLVIIVPSSYDKYFIILKVIPILA